MDQSIGVMDSGVGGLTVVKEIMRQLPKEKMVYLGDTERCPYGPRPDEEIIKFTWEMVDYLLEKNLKALVVACNTATALTLPDLQKKLTIPVIGVVQPGARAAIKATNHNQIAVIGTNATIRSQAYEKALQDIHSNITIHSLACPTLVPMVEKGYFSGKEAENIVQQALQPIKNYREVDTLILGCTHYPLIIEPIQKIIGDHVTLVSSSGETARELSAILEMKHLLYTGHREPHHYFYTTGNVSFFQKMAHVIFNHFTDPIRKVSMEQVVINAS